MINKLLEKHYYAGGFGVSTIPPNKTIKPSDLSKLPIYAKWQLMPLRDRMGTLSSIQHTGILQITLFVDVAIGTELIDAKAQAIVNHFGTEKSHNVETTDFKSLAFTSVTRYANKLEFTKNPIFVQILIMSSTANAAMPDGFGKYMMPITIEYRAT